MPGSLIQRIVQFVAALIRIGLSWVFYSSLAESRTLAVSPYPFARSPLRMSALRQCLLTQDQGTKVRRLVFTARRGAAKASSPPGRVAIAQFVREHFGIEVTVEELVDPALG